MCTPCSARRCSRRCGSCCWPRCCRSCSDIVVGVITAARAVQLARLRVDVPRLPVLLAPGVLARRAPQGVRRHQVQRLPGEPGHLANSDDSPVRSCRPLLGEHRRWQLAKTPDCRGNRRRVVSAVLLLLADATEWLDNPGISMPVLAVLSLGAAVSGGKDVRPTRIPPPCLIAGVVSAAIAVVGLDRVRRLVGRPELDEAAHPAGAVGVGVGLAVGWFTGCGRPPRCDEGR